MNEIDWGLVEVGKQYRYEEKYHLQAVVTVLEDKSTSDMHRFSIRFDEICGGIGTRPEVGSTLEVGKTKDQRYAYLVQGHNFKPLDAMFEYYCGGGQR
jgi:hypothetical protein